MRVIGVCLDYDSVVEKYQHDLLVFIQKYLCVVRLRAVIDWLTVLTTLIVKEILLIRSFSTDHQFQLH